MSQLQGSAAKAAYKQAVTWGTAVALGDGDQIEYATENIVPDVQLIDSDQITGQALSGPSDTGRVIVQGELGGIDLKYSGAERFLKGIFGGETPSADGAGFKHKFNFTLSNAGIFGTLAFEKVVTGDSNSIHEIDSFKPMGVVITGAAGAPVKMTLKGIGRHLSNGGSVTNVSSSSWALPGKGHAPETRRVVKFGQCVIEVAAAPVAVQATGYYSYTGSNPSASDTVVVGARTYTFVVSPAVNDDVKIGVDSDASALNLARAINMSGGTNGAGQDYLVASAHPLVRATLDSILNRVNLQAILGGVGGNSVGLTTMGTYTRSGTTLTGGTAGTPSYTPICASGFTISLQRTGDPVQTTCDGDYVSEPATDTVEITGQLDFPIYDDANEFLVAANIAKSVLTLRYTFTSPDSYDSGKFYRYVLYVPGVQLQGGYPNVGGKGRVPLTVTWKAHNAVAPVDTDATMPRLYLYNATADIADYSNS
jgi:hypothetical protein